MRTKDDTKDYTGGAEVARLTENLSKALEPTVKQIKTFNSGIEPILKRINKYTQELSKAFEPGLERIKEIAERLRLFKIEYEREYTIIRKRYDAQLKKDDYITPLDADEYLIWLMCKNESNPKANLIEEAKKAYNFTLFHEYMIRCLKSDWDIIKELDYWEKQPVEDTKKKSIEEIEQATLRQFFDSEEMFEEAIAKLDDKKYINPDTLYWIDTKKGNKSLAASIIEALYYHGYLNERPSKLEIVSICKNTFKLDIKIDTAKQSNVDRYNFDFLER